jgi:hypothetical protein
MLQSLGRGISIYGGFFSLLKTTNIWIFSAIVILSMAKLSCDQQASPENSNFLQTPSDSAEMSPLRDRCDILAEILPMAESAYTHIESSRQFAPRSDDPFTDRFSELNHALDNYLEDVVERELNKADNFNFYVYQSDTDAIFPSSYIMQHMKFETFQRIFLQENLKIKRTKESHPDLISQHVVELLVNQDPLIQSWILETAPKDHNFQREMIDLTKSNSFSSTAVEIHALWAATLSQFGANHEDYELFLYHLRFLQRSEIILKYFINDIYPNIENPGPEVDAFFNEAIDRLEIIQTIISAALEDVIDLFNPKCFEQLAEPENLPICQSPFSEQKYTLKQLLDDLSSSISNDLNYVIKTETQPRLTGYFSRTIHLDQTLHGSSDCIYTANYQIQRSQSSGKKSIQLTKGEVILKTWSQNHKKLKIVLDRKSFEKLLQENLSLLR